MGAGSELMPAGQSDEQPSILASVGQFDADPDHDYKQHRLHKQAELGDAEVDPEAVAWLQERAARASREKFDAAMAQVPDAAPLPGDEVE